MGNSPNPKSDRPLSLKKGSIHNLQFNDCWNQIGVTGDRTCPELNTYTHCRNCPVYSSAGRTLLDRIAPEGYLHERTQLLTQQKEEQAIGTIAVNIFRIKAEWLALPASLFTEVTDPAPIHKIPHRSNEILLGLVNLRGEILLCISLGELLHLEAVEPNHKVSPLVYKRMVVVEAEGSRWVFPVDEIYGVHRIHPDELQNVPATVSKAAGTYTKAMIHWQDKSVSYLDEELLFYSLNRRIL